MLSRELSKIGTVSLLCFLLLVLFSVGCERETVHREISIDLSRGKKTISSDDAPAAIGPYSQAVLAGNTLYSSGQIGIDPETGKLVEGGVAAETERIMQNHRSVLEAAGMGFGDVVKATVYLTDISDYATFNEIYARYFSGNKPAREAVAVAALPAGAAVEISFISVKSD